MKIYTKTGDKGQTSLFGGKRVSKDDIRIEAYGTVDELNSILGICRSMNTTQDVDTILINLQNLLFTVGAELATPPDSRKNNFKQITPDDSLRLEGLIDTLEQKVEPLTNFILPGGNRAASNLHLARTVCRRAERIVVTLERNEPGNNNVIIFLNRLSDLLFVLARFVNALSNTPEIKWQS